MRLVELKNDDIKEFKKLMIEAFQYGYESVYGKDKGQVLPDTNRPLDSYEEDDGMIRFEKNMK